MSTLGVPPKLAQKASHALWSSGEASSRAPTLLALVTGK